jgi:hypothetical protein
MSYYILYETTNLINGKRYRGIHKTENLDDGYLGSGYALLESIKKYGKENFSREILEFCDSYDELIEVEKIYVDEQWVKDKFNYNLKTGGQSYGVLSEESKSKISETLRNKYKNGLLKINPNFGNGVPWNKNKTGIYSDDTKKSISNSLKGRVPWNKGKIGVQKSWNKGLKMGPMSDLDKQRRSDTLKEKFKNIEHHSKGVEPWNKGKKGLQQAWNKGKEMEKIECPHCGKFCDKMNAKKWHFDKCKKKMNTKSYKKL